MTLPEEAFEKLDAASKVLLERHPLWGLLSELSACLCARLTDSCFCGILVGDDLPVEFVGECEGDGTAYVRMMTAFPSSVTFPEPDVTLGEFGVRAFTVGVGILRQVGWGEDAPEVDPLDAQRHALLLLADQQAAWEAIVCCFADKYDDLLVSAPVYTPFPLQGNISGGEWVLTIQQPF